MNLYKQILGNEKLGLELQKKYNAKINRFFDYAYFEEIKEDLTSNILNCLQFQHRFSDREKKCYTYKRVNNLIDLILYGKQEAFTFSQLFSLGINKIEKIKSGKKKPSVTLEINICKLFIFLILNPLIFMKENYKNDN